MRSFVRVIVLLLAVGALSRCTVYRELELTQVEDMRMVQFSGSGIALEADVKIENPNKYKVKLTAADLDMKANNTYVGKVSLDKPTSIPKKSHQTHTIYFTVNQERMSLDILTQMFIIGLTGKATIDIKGYVKGKGMGIGVKVPVDHKEVVRF